MAERKTDRRKIESAGPLDYASDPERSHSVTFCRFQFLLAAFKLEPQMTEGLRELLRLRMNNAPPDAYRAALDDWVGRYNLGVDRWCRRWLLQTLRFSHLMAAEQPDSEPRINLAYHFDGPPPVQVPPAPTWNPFELSAKTLEQRYKAYINTVQAAFRQAGYSPIADRRQPAHFWWLAGYQCCGWSQNRIAEAERIDRAAVVRAIHKATKDIGLTLRPGKDHNPSWTIERIRAALHPPVT